jgi:hypothetical protein
MLLVGSICSLQVSDKLIVREGLKQGDSRELAKTFKLIPLTLLT